MVAAIYPAWAETTDAWRTFLHRLTGFEAHFEQTLLDERGQVLERLQGILYLQVPGRFHWAYEQPYVQKIISDGTSIWFYDQDLAQVTIRAAADVLHRTPALISLGHKAVTDQFIQINLGRIEDLDWVQLLPRSEAVDYQTIRIGLKGDSLAMMVLLDQLGQTTRVDFFETQHHQSLDERLFRFDIPAATEIIDARP